MDDMVAEGQSTAPREGHRLLSLTSPQEATISASNWCASSLATHYPLALPLALVCGQNALGGTRFTLVSRVIHSIAPFHKLNLTLWTLPSSTECYRRSTLFCLNLFLLASDCLSRTDYPVKAAEARLRLKPSFLLEMSAIKL